jgi:hypothetical protein
MTDQDRDHGRVSVIDAMRDQVHVTPLPARRTTWLPAIGPKVFTGATLALAALIVAAVLALDGASSPPALAITRGAHGLMTITLNRRVRLATINARFAALGVRIRVVPITHGCIAPVEIIGPGGRLEPRRTLRAATSTAPGGHTRSDSGWRLTMSIAPPTAHGRLIVLAASDSGIELAAREIEGPAPACVRFTPPGQHPFLIPVG